MDQVVTAGSGEEGQALNIFAGYAWDRRILDLVRNIEGDMNFWALAELPRLPRWSRGRVVLLGDAAHAPLPHQGQGAGMAIEDAYILGALLAKGGLADYGPVFAAFENLRRRRAWLVQAYSRAAGRSYKFRGGAAAQRDASWPSLPQRIGWIHRYRAEEAVPLPSGSAANRGRGWRWRALAGQRRAAGGIPLTARHAGPSLSFGPKRSVPPAAQGALMKPNPVPLPDVNLADLDVFERNEAWGMFDTLREQAPVHWTTEAGGNKGFWAITRFEDIERIDKDPATFTSTKFTNLEEPPEEYQDLRRSMLETDGPRHLALRKLLLRDFSIGPLRRYEDFLRDLARVTVDTALPGGTTELDFVQSIAADFPINVLARLLAVPGEKIPQLISWGNEIVGATDPEYARVLVDSPESEQYRHLPFRSPASQEIFEYGRKLAAERRGGDGDDLVSKLINRVPEDGVPLTDTDFDNYFLLLVVAGNETTRQAISHSMKALIDSPEQLAYLRDNPDKSQIAVEELFRWASPVYHFRRTATRDVELHGQQIKAGDKVVIWFASGNRDARVFADPYRLDLTRFPNDHMSFGKGPHSCLGSNLARLEVRIMFETLLPRLASIEQAGNIVRVRSNFVNGIKRFPVRITARG